jgi:hypothetical protein
MISMTASAEELGRCLQHFGDGALLVRFFKDQECAGLVVKC